MQFVRFEVFTNATKKNVVFWDVSPCGYYRNRRLGGTYRLHLQGENNQGTVALSMLQSLAIANVFLVR
jgi:hypothetical protein